jgi:predicted kinase
MQQEVIVFSGPPLAGKSTLAARVAVELNCPYLEMDEARLALLPDSKQTPQDRDIAYRAVRYTATKLLAAGVPRVILCATYNPALHREGVGEMVQEFSAGLFVISCTVEPDEAVNRFRQRKGGHAAVDLTEDKVRRSAVDARPFLKGLVIDSSAMSEDEAVTKILQYVTSRIAVRDVDAWVQMGFRGPRT